MRDRMDALVHELGLEENMRVARKALARRIEADTGINRKTLRMRLGLSPAELAKLLDIDPAQMAAIEAGRGDMDAEFMRRYADTLGVGLDELANVGADAPGDIAMHPITLATWQTIVCPPWRSQEERFAAFAEVAMADGNGISVHPLKKIGLAAPGPVQLVYPSASELGFPQGAPYSELLSSVDRFGIRVYPEIGIDLYLAKVTAVRERVLIPMPEFDTRRLLILDRPSLYIRKWPISNDPRNDETIWPNDRLVFARK